jgi:hypothetical protein
MADIRIQEKKNPVWPWILLIIILIVAAVLIYLYLRDNGTMNDEYDSVPPDTTRYYEQDTLGLGGGLQEPDDEVEQFRAFTTEDTMGTFSKEYVANGLSMLSGALYSVVHRGDTVSQQVVTRTDSLMQYTMNLNDTTNRNFSRDVSRSMTTAVEIISNVQKSNYPQLNREITELRSAVKSFDASKPVEAQERPVRNFFRVSGSILSDMQNTARAI